MFMYTDYTQHLLDNVKKIHFIGCGGSGMYPLIQILSAKGYDISGSDVLDGSIIRSEREMGVKVTLGHSADNVVGADLVVYSAAIAKDNVELNAAASYGITTVERSVLLGYVSRLYKESICVSGTHGKTTTTYLLKAILEQELGAKVGLIGTIQNMIGDRVLHTERTTPESFELQKLLREMADAGCTHVVMEVSSHALMLDRVYGIPFAVGIYTNLSRDHLDFHKTMEAYCDAKALLMRQCDVGIYNADDPWAERLMADATCPRRFSYSVNGQADLMAKNVALEPGSVDFDAEADTEWCHVHVGIPALFTVYNTLDAMACCWNLGVPLAECANALAKNHGVKGRMEIIPTPGTGYTVLNDYAHKPDALEKVLQSAKAFAKGRVVALFGCGGDRDKTKRPEMAQIAVKYATTAILTSDNPRHEDPDAILDDMVAGLAPGDRYLRIADRAEAIRTAAMLAKPGDILLLAGKGHETYQIVGDVKNHFDDKEEALRAFALYAKN